MIIDDIEYLSYSRAFTFIENKWKFIKIYILKQRKLQEISKFHRMHKIIEIYFKNKDLLIKKEKKYQTKQLNDFYNNAKKSYLLTDSESDFLIAFQNFINMKYNADLKKCLESKIFSKKLKCEEKKIRGELDCVDASTIIDFKGETIDSLKYKKLKYALQQVIYMYLFKTSLNLKNVNYYFLSLPLSYPFDFNRFTFPDSWLEGVYTLFFNKILPEYNKYITKLKEILGQDIFYRRVEQQEHTDILNILVESKLLSVDFELTPSSYEYNDLDLQIYGNKHMVEFY